MAAGIAYFGPIPSNKMPAGIWATAYAAKNVAPVAVDTDTA
eukprot:CAMPEP_0172903250 /NCGR_PEP_ID=MMETSP1075-20121228/170135_1 /TAXON_ID=2916 /ORGANISM="Ceratium fusus, Strain PA161109" /LENGTH=40 /DNA_ID= /DNA_START= /DNA_END= /DNA_ORIENTATION=